MSKIRKSSTIKKILLFGIILLIIAIGIIIIYNVIQNDKNQVNEKELKIKKITSKTFTVEGKEAKYTLLRNEDGTVYGVEFQNLDAMKTITVINTGEKEEIKDLIINNIYRFKTNGICKLKIETIDGRNITTAPFKVIIQETTIE